MAGKKAKMKEKSGKLQFKKGKLNRKKGRMESARKSGGMGTKGSGAGCRRRNQKIIKNATTAAHSRPIVPTQQQQNSDCNANRIAEKERD